MDIILFGIQGSGKGTQGKILADRFGLTIFEMGGELRKAIESGTPLGQKVKSIVESGNLVSDDTILEIVSHCFADHDPKQSVLFDGIPRTLVQSEKLLALLSERQRDAFALFIKISEQEAEKRLTQRRICSLCKGVYPFFYKADVCQHCGGPLITRSDDNPESIRKRLRHYSQETLPVIQAFYERDRLIEVDGEQPIDAVTKEMLEKVAYLFS